jgi:hypothetical protein
MPNTFQLSASADSDTDFNTGSVFFVGTATVILRYAGFTIFCTRATTFILVTG